VSIGAGPRPSSPAIAVYEWQAFVGQCQASTNARMVDGLALLVVAGFLLLVASPLVGRAWRGQRRASAHTAAAGWYPDPSGAAPWRWWDGHQWSPETRTGQAPDTDTASAAAAPPFTAAPPASPSPSGRGGFSAEPRGEAAGGHRAGETAPPQGASPPG
jgi:hypothetical protein